MQLRVFNNTLINGQWTGVGVGNFAPDIAEHLIRIGNAEPYETKTVEPTEVKKAEPSSASRPDRALTNETVPKRRGRPRKTAGKPSSSTTATE